MQDHTSRPAHSCAHCVDIVFPGTPETIQVTWSSSLKALLSKRCFVLQGVNNLGLSLADLRVGTDAGCDFLQHLKDFVEPCLYEGAVADVVQLYTCESNDGNMSTMTIEPLISLQKLRLPDDVFDGYDPSRCFTNASRGGRNADIPFVLIEPSGGNLDGQFHLKRPISLDPLSARTVTAICAWLKGCEDECNGNHKICSLSERAYVPTRLLKISGHPSRLQLKLVHRKDIEEHEVSRYVALSYCWGGSQPNKLTHENHDLYKMGVTWEALPKAIQDAARTVHALGLHYIWVDSMCIIQDSKEDKDAEISQMTNIYAHAMLTIINRRSEKVTEGFLHARTLPSGTSSIQVRTNDGQTHRVTLVFTETSGLEDSSAVNTRGWTLQEYLLSRRRLTIGTWSTEWRCRREDDAHRDGWFDHSHFGQTTFIPDISSGDGWAGGGSLGSHEAHSVYGSKFIDAAMFFSVNPGYPSRPLVEDLVRKSWYAIAAAYSSRSLTDSEDKILAISGIAERFARFVPKRYIAGIWENMMPEALFWKKDHGLSDRPVKYRGPSWSWSSIDGGVSCIPCSSYMCKVLSVDYALKRADAPYGAVSSATLHIESRALCVEWKYTRSERSPKADISEFRWHKDGYYHKFGAYTRPIYDEEDRSEVFEFLDAREQNTGWSEVILLAYSLNNPSRVYRTTSCIVLIQVDQIEVDNKPRERFRRLGYIRFDTFSGPPLPHVEEWSTKSYFVI